MLVTFIDELRSGKRESSAMSVLSTGSLSQDEKEEWRQLRKELESIGITPDVFARNRDFILNTLRALSQDDCEYSFTGFATEYEEPSSSGISHEACRCDCLPGMSPENDMIPLFQTRYHFPVDPTSSCPHAPSNFDNEAFLNDHPYHCEYRFFRFQKANLLPGNKANWNHVERTEINLTRRSLHEMVRKRAHKFDAAQQYQLLSITRRAHINQLIHELRRIYTTFAWSCAYAKEHDRIVQGSSNHYECTAVDVIIMGIGNEVK